MILSSILIVVVSTAVGVGSQQIPREPDIGNFLKSFVGLSDFKNWADDIKYRNLITHFPKEEDEVLAVINQAYVAGAKVRPNPIVVRPSGQMHSWAPVTVQQPKAQDKDLIPTVEDLVETAVDLSVSGLTGLYSDYNRPTPVNGETRTPWLVKTLGMDKMGIISKEYGNSSFWAQPGILMDHLLQRLQEEGLGLAHFPAPGELTLGGVLAIGGHGTAVPARGETLEKGHTYGSVSNLIIKFTAVVYNETVDKYVLKEFDRSDPDSGAFLVNLGRTFITNVTMRAGPLQHLRCLSYTNITANEIFAHPDDSKATNNLTRFLDESGRVEVIHFAFDYTPWLKVWSVTEQKPAESRELHAPYPYPWSHLFPRSLTLAGEDLENVVENTVGLHMGRFTGRAKMEVVREMLKLTQSEDIWGTSRQVFHYLRSSTLSYTANGYAILTNRQNIQRVAHLCYKKYNELLEEYAKRNSYPINGAIEARVIGLDNPDDVLVRGAQVPFMSPVSPLKNKPEFDTAFYFDVLSFTRIPCLTNFMQDLEEYFYATFDGKWAQVRVEWSKAWAYDKNRGDKGGVPYANKKVLRRLIPESFDSWSQAVDIFNKYDAPRVLTNEFLTDLLEPNES